MAKDPAMLWYPADWINGTLGMSFEEKGAYMELLMMQFSRGHLTTRMIGQTVGQLWVNIKDKFIEDDAGLWYNKRLEDEKDRRKNYVSTRNNNRSGNNQHTKAKKTEAGQMTSDMVNTNEDYNTIHNLLHNKVKQDGENFFSKNGEQRPPYGKW